MPGAITTHGNAKSAWRTAWFAIFLLGACLRLLRISWQPLWWDEGYSVFFATEPLGTMFALTAQDIHPPLYYTLLHFWFTLFGNTQPETARLLSIFIGTATLPVLTWTSLTLWPGQRRLALLATFLLAVNPMHLFYSQEIRMYGLAMLLTLASSTILWQMHQQLESGLAPYRQALVYVIVASLALLTLYYAGLLLLAHQLWVVATNRRNPKRLLWYFIPALFVLLIQLPWWNYTFPKLIAYVADKVLADQDTSLPIVNYLWRHWLSFLVGHVSATIPALGATRIAIAALLAPLLVFAATMIKLGTEKVTARWLVALILTPLLVGFAVNVRFPFFPEGGERLLLQLLPYILLLLSLAISKLFEARRRMAVATLTLTLVAALIGNIIFFMVPRYAEHDYRPIIADVMAQSRPNDTVLALFPWQVGYWRAYSPRAADGTLLSPQPAAVDQSILVWDSAIEAQLERALEQGTLWFPMPLSFGSTLPVKIEGYLASHARNLENKWYSPATRLSAWVQKNEMPEPAHSEISFQDEVSLVSSSVSPQQIVAGNEPLSIDLCWKPVSERVDLRATLRLQDENGYTWAKRDLTPLANFIAMDPSQRCRESLAMNIPTGIPPGSYSLAIGVGSLQNDSLLSNNLSDSPLAILASLEVTAPSESLSSYRLPIEHRFTSPIVDSELMLLGYTGPDHGDRLLAGDALALTLFVQNKGGQAPKRDLFISVLGSRGNGVDGWEGWPLPDYPTTKWPQGALTQLPIHFFLSPELTPGHYSLITGFVDPASGEKSSVATLAEVEIIRRPANFKHLASEHQVMPEAIFGTHAMLTGYDFSQDGQKLQLYLTWKVLQPLLPPHHIFVHVSDATGGRIAQSDTEPQNEHGRAPTGSWLPNEYLITQHIVELPPTAQHPLTLQVGLYLPDSGERLPVTVEGRVIGDSVTLMLSAAP